MLTGGILAVAGFAIGMHAMNRYLRAREVSGDFDVAPSTAAQPGLRRFFDYSPSGWSGDGRRQATSRS